MKLQTPVHLFNTLLKNTDVAATLVCNTTDTFFSYNRLPSLNIQTSHMDSLMGQSNKEAVKNTMLKHEEIFKHQVRELHRLYRVQKKLMGESQTPRTASDTRIRFWNSASTSETSSMNRNNMKTGPSSRELSICSGEPFRMQRGINLEQTAEEGMATAVPQQDQRTIFWGHFRGNSSIECRDSLTDCDNELELTLSIGGSSSVKKPKHRLLSDAG